jgi:hypothetical protein
MNRSHKTTAWNRKRRSDILPISSRSGVSFAFSSFCVALLVFLSPAHAQNIEQRIDRSQSRFHFEMSGDFINLSGKFNSYAGSILIDPRTKRPLVVKIQVDISNVSIARTGTLGSFDAFSPEAVFESLPDPKVTFLSKQILPLSGNTYLVKGVLRRGQKEWQQDLRASVAIPSAIQTIVIANLSGPVFGLADQLPFHINGSRDSGKLECRLVFVPPQNLQQTRH